MTVVHQQLISTAFAWDQKIISKESTDTISYSAESKQHIPSSPTLQTLHMFYTQNIIPPFLNTLILSSPTFILQNKLWATVEWQGFYILMAGVIWRHNLGNNAEHLWSLHDSKLWNSPASTHCPTLFHALLIRVQPSPRDLHTSGHELSHLAKRSTNTHKSEQPVAVTCTAKILDVQYWEQKKDYSCTTHTA